ncbi:hypothetical protein PJIAN_3356 [Paludibacter jiangxiensis]|uniref:Uncharacterized protein n=1 Tax=Paludibacter jiangxiensis TaxID=681398 RepID=A0A161L804_9BACT|nr:hypothetical protein PJIAN_3356 [Paludibacter jiangxiensis]
MKKLFQLRYITKVTLYEDYKNKRQSIFGINP